ncbi:uncharacterized protein LOC130743653 [Lotus japonicus]|uniref:uncharacterized protein LOC130743653 n=1 Tax=Lotus japonicus TaxID=34305 RepID=UPI0025910A54|nr:uncharacterized protein LOC130743653 [Lotus japonicus]
MDFEFVCKVYPNILECDSATEISQLCPVDQFFNVEFEIRNVHDATHSNTYRRFGYISKENMMQENVESLLSSVGLPNDAFRFVVPKILEGADEINKYLEEGDEDFGLVPSIEELVQEEFKQEGNCAICFEDFHVGVRMPCLHMFHKNCITSWLQVANSCPLCRFHMPMNDEQNS